MTALAAFGAAVAAIGAAFASFFSDETTAEGGETILWKDISMGRVIRLKKDVGNGAVKTSKRSLDWIAGCEGDR